MAEGDGTVGPGDTGAGGDVGGGEGTPAFLETIQNEELRGNEFLKNFDSPDSLADGYVSLRNSQPVIPENTEGYQMDIPENANFDESDFNSFKEASHKAGLTNEQWQAVVQYDYERSQQWNKSQEEAVTEAAAELTKDWGDKFDENISKATNVLSKTGFEDLGDDELVRSNPQFAKFLFHISTIISEDKLGPRGNPAADSRDMGEDGKPLLNFPSMD